MNWQLLSSENDTMFEGALRRWRLTPDGEPIATATSRLLPVRRDGRAAMLKIATEPEERRGAEMMLWWAGDGAARVLAHARAARRKERAAGTTS
jgi:streptomycin 6-kinase